MLGPSTDTQFIAPDAIEPAIGFRTWHLSLTDDGFVLASPDRGDRWPAREALEAQFTTSDPNLRDVSNCGINAWDGPERMNGRYAGCTVHGTIKLWGQVRGYEKGWRGEFAYPMELSIAGELPDAEVVAAEIAERYGVPCTVREVSKMPHRRRAATLHVRGQHQLDLVCARYKSGEVAISYSPEEVRGAYSREGIEKVRVPDGWVHPLTVSGGCDISGRTVAELRPGAGVHLSEHAHVSIGCNDENTVHAEGDAVVHSGGDDRPPHAYSPTVTLHGRARAFMRSGSVSLGGDSEATISHCVAASAQGSSTVYARGSSVVHAKDETTVHASGHATVHATPSVTVHLSGDAICHRVPDPDAPRAKRDQFGLPDHWSDLDVVNGHVRLYAQVRCDAPFGARRGETLAPEDAIRRAVDKKNLVLHRGPRETLWNFDRPDVMIAAWECPVELVRHDGTHCEQVVCSVGRIVAIVDEHGAPRPQWQPLVDEISQQPAEPG